MSLIAKAPYFRTRRSTDVIMRDVLIALIPVSIMAIVNFGIKSLFMILLGIGSAIFFEFLVQKIQGKETTISDFSAAVTGLLVALSYPVTAPYWIVLLGTFIAIVLVKQLPGGLGKNRLNPAVFSRVFIKITLTPYMTNWVTPGPDIVATATPLEFIGNGQTDIAQGAPQMMDVFMGNIGGGIGETTKWAILLGAAYLIFRKVIHGGVPLATLVGLFVTALLFSKSNYEYALYHVLSGTVMFASVFMVTDYSSSPLNPKAKIYFALAIGILTGILRFSFGLPGGIGAAILLMNLCTDFFDSKANPRVFGFKASRKLPDITR